MQRRGEARSARRGAGWRNVCVRASVGIGLAVCAVASGPARADIPVLGGSATLRWTPASGPVSGYQVFVARNGGAARVEALVTATEVTLTGQPGERVEVSVRAYGFPSGFATQGPFSPVSDTLLFLNSNVALSGLAVLDCASCGVTALRAIPSGKAINSLAHPAGGTWDLIRFGRYSGGTTVQALLREQTTGALWIGDVSGSTLVPRASLVQSGFATRQAMLPVDFDGDGADEFVLRDPASGVTEVWGLVNGAIARRTSYSVTAAWSLVAIRDFDRDGQADLWFDTHGGTLWVFRTRNFAYAGAVSIPVPLSGYAAVDVADYDGDGQLDVAWRRSDGALALSLLRGSTASPAVDVQELPFYAGDDRVSLRSSADLDGAPGAELVLQSDVTGAVDVEWAGGSLRGAREHLLDSDPLSRLAQVAR